MQKHYEGRGGTEASRASHKILKGKWKRKKKQRKSRLMRLKARHFPAVTSSACHFLLSRRLHAPFSKEWSKTLRFCCRLGAKTRILSLRQTCCNVSLRSLVLHRLHTRTRRPQRAEPAPSLYRSITMLVSPVQVTSSRRRLPSVLLARSAEVTRPQTDNRAIVALLCHRDINPPTSAQIPQDASVLSNRKLNLWLRQLQPVWSVTG